MEYALQYHSWGDASFNAPVNPSIAVNIDFFKTAAAKYTGTSSIGTFTGGNSANAELDTFSGSPQFNPNQVAIHQRGYIYAKYTGTYVFTVDLSDNEVVLWIGAKAYSGWEVANANSVNQLYNKPTARITMDLVACSYTPLRVIGINGNGPMTYQFSVTDPKGYQIIGPSSVSNDAVLTHSCDGKAAPPFAAFGKES